MIREQFHTSRRQFLQISALFAISTVTAPIAQALIVTPNGEPKPISHLNNPLNRAEIRSLDFDSHLFPLHNYRRLSDPLSISKSLYSESLF